MPRTMIAALAAAAVALSLTACASGAHHAHGIQSARPYPTASHQPVVATPLATPRPTDPAATLSTSPGDELFTFSGAARSSNGSAAALTFTVHSPVAWNSQGGTATLAALAAAGASSVGDQAHLLDPVWDATNRASLAVVDYTAQMTAGSWLSGQTVQIHLGPFQSEVPVSSAGLELDPHSRWVITGPGSGHFVVAYPNVGGTAPDPSTWGDQLQIYGFDLGLSGIDAPNAYQFRDCRLDLTPLGERPAAVPENWFTPATAYCSAGVGD